MDWACFAAADGRIFLGEGPFEQRSEEPAAGVAFYRNDFALSESKPWWVPARVEEVTSLEAVFSQCNGRREVEWEEIDAGRFAEVFREVTAAIGGGQLEKSVPVVTEQGRWQGPPSEWADFPGQLAKGMRLFGWGEAGAGVLSATPEQLFRLDRGLLETMALAGTSRREDRELFAVDEKEIREHEFVAQTLMAKLADFGMVRRKARQVMDLGQLIHFHTPIEVELYQNESPERLVRRLHPTPALGPLPRTAETLDWLLDWRQRLHCPRWFGAPFGFWHDGVFEALVGIRMVLWEGEQVMVPSGCGVIEASRLVNEWRELRLKREAVRGLFRLG
ncbi:MAG: chorismate-binding protein [Verrucomicrobiota bacterium JB023]|nr:chorismate-binding protein [Verrucomicrobiota bacterium JB023]